MNTTFDVLVIVLSCLLGLFLILSIVIAALTVKLVRSLRQIVAKGEQLVDSAEEFGETLRRGAGMAGVLKLVLKVVSAVNKAKKE